MTNASVQKANSDRANEKTALARAALGKDIRAKWDKFSEIEVGALRSEEQLVTQLIAKYSLSSIQTFGGTPDDNFMVVIDDSSKKRRLVFSGISKIKVMLYRGSASPITANSTFA